MVAMSVALTLAAAAVSAVAQAPDAHYWHQGVIPPGAIGSRQLQRGGPLPGYFQPVEIKAPRGALLSLASQGRFEASQTVPRRAGMLLGQVYRMRVTNLPNQPGIEVFPTIEVIDRLYPPRGQEARFAIPVEISMEDIFLALDGKFVTRVIYLENPRAALPVREDPQAQSWFEAKPDQDPLAVADALGRPVAILRMGGRLPINDGCPEPQFLYGCPPYMPLPARPARMPAREQAPETPQP